MASIYDKPIIISTSGSAANTSGTLIGVMVSATSSNGSAVIKDGTTSGGSEILSVNCLANDTKLIDLSRLGGVPYSSGLHITVSNAKAFIWKE